MDNLILDDQFYIELESLRIKLFGESFYDEESNTHIEIDGLNPADYVDLFEYNNNISDVYYRFKESHDELIYTIKLLELFDLEEVKKKIPKSEYLKLHIKYWHIKLATVLDLSLKLMGNVFDLRISDRYMDSKIIENNRYLKPHSDIVANLKNLKKLVETDIRNNIIHHQIFNNDVLNETTLTDFFGLLSIDLGDEIEININVEILIGTYYSKTELFTKCLNKLINSLIPTFKEYSIKKEKR